MDTVQCVLAHGICGGKTIRKFRKRVQNHVGDIVRNANISILSHFHEHHNGISKLLKVIGIEKVTPPVRGGDWD